MMPKNAEPRAVRRPSPLIALAGNPNSGKTALFNALTGARQKVANYPGVTVERREGLIRWKGGPDLRLLDLPGAYSLEPRSPDEEIMRDVLLDRHASRESPEAVIAVADAANLERNLGLVLELKAIGKPVILALNMIDLATKRGLRLDEAALSRELGVPVVPTVAIRNEGVGRLLETVTHAIEAKRAERGAADALRAVVETEPAPAVPPSAGESLERVRRRREEVDRILRRSVKVAASPHAWTHRIDRVALHPIVGPLVLVAVMALVFQAIFNWAAAPQEWIESFISWVGAGLASVMPDGPLKDLLVDGVIAGVGAVLVFLPQILLLFFFILLLEDSGYMARAAFVMDRLMGRVGLHGRAFIPLLSSFACAIPGVLATRTISSRRDRLVTILVVPLMACSARMPVYSLLIGAFVPNTPIFGPFRLQGLVMMGLFLAGVGVALAVAYLMKRMALRGPRAEFLMELPTYKWPSWRNVVLGLQERAGAFVSRAGTMILSLSVLLWFLATYPKPAAGLVGAEAGAPAIHSSYAGRIGMAVEPVLRPLGFDWRISTALIPGFAAREVMVSALATVYAVEAKSTASDAAAAAEGSGESPDAEEAESRALSEWLRTHWSLATALSLLVWYIFAPQCLATFAVIRRETGSLKWTVGAFAYLLALAYVASFVTYRVATWLGAA